MIRVWDLFVRISHWLIVLLIISAYLSVDYGDSEFKWHSWNGYAVFILVFSRLIWGVIGSTTARFSHFIKSPFRVIQYLRDLLTGSSIHSLGHNPAGGWMVVMFWLILLAQPVTGLFSSDDILVEGPLSYMVSESVVSTMTSLHHSLFDLLIIFIIVHIIAVIFHQFIKKEKLIQAMFHGNKPCILENKQQNTATIFRSLYLALLIVSVVTAVFIFVVNHYS